MTAPRVGEEIEGLVIEAVDPGRMKTVALLLRDPNPIHWDTGVTERAGLGDRPINQGPVNMSYLIEAAAAAAGGPDRIEAFRARFLGNVRGGDRVECTGSWTAVDAAAGRGTIELIASVGREPVVSAEATVRWN